MPVPNIIKHKKKKRRVKKVIPVPEDIESQEDDSDEEEIDGFSGIIEYFEESIDIWSFLSATIYFLLSFALPFLNKVKQIREKYSAAHYFYLDPFSHL